MPRTLEFNPDDALQKAVTYFWQHGYEGTHMRDLADYMGISKSSFYNTYGDKHQVYISALNAYLEQEYAELKKLLQTDPPPDVLLPALFFNVSARSSSAELGQGSFLVNAAVERAPHDPETQAVISDHFRRFADLLTQYFTRKQSEGIIAASFRPRLHAHTLISNLYSLGVLARLNLGFQAREDVIEAAMVLYQGA